MCEDIDLCKDWKKKHAWTADKPQRIEKKLARNLANHGNKMILLRNFEALLFLSSHSNSRYVQQLTFSRDDRT